MQVIYHFWCLYRRVCHLVWILSSSSHPSCHFFCFLQIFKSHHSGVTGFNLLILNTSIFPDHFFYLLLVQFLNHFKKLLPFLLVNSWQIFFFNSLLNISLSFLFLLQSHSPLKFLRINICFALVIWFIFISHFFLLKLKHFGEFLHPLASLPISLTFDLLILPLMFFDVF